MSAGCSLNKVTGRDLVEASTSRQRCRTLEADSMLVRMLGKSSLFCFCDEVKRETATK